MHDAISPTSSMRPLFMVDDDEADRRHFARLLRDAGVSNPVRLFPHGEDLIDELIAVLRGAPPPLACFIDVKMPGMTGFDVLRWIRCQHNFTDLPAIMLSSSEEPRDLVEAQHFGAQCYIAKFPAPGQLQAILRETQRMAAAATSEPFKLPCNLLISGSPAM